MCHFGSLSMTWQLSYPHHYLAVPARVRDMQGFNVGGSRGDIITLFHKASDIQYVHEAVSALLEQSRANQPHALNTKPLHKN